jgi:hypothetical protein
VTKLDSKEWIDHTIRGTLDLLLSGDSYGDRRGAAYGLAGLVKGLGISALKAHNIMSVLQNAAMDNSKIYRQGALFAFELLSERLGRLFEPFVIQILPFLLNSCGDGDENVREAAELAARTVMSQLSGQGVKLVMPALLQGVEDRAWRTKSASIELLGAMAYCAPRQLSTCLPTIVPVLASAVSNTHPKVRADAVLALKKIGEVIKNPEILAVAPTLLDSLSEPDKTSTALDVVIETTFVNAVDAPSLALLIPVVGRGLRHSSAETKKKAAIIVRNICNLVSVRALSSTFPVSLCVFVCQAFLLLHLKTRLQIRKTCPPTLTISFLLSNAVSSITHRKCGNVPSARLVRW